MRSRSTRQRRQPKPPFPRQHQQKPGVESRMRPRPRYEAPTYLPAGKFEGFVALVTGADSGIGRAVVLLFAREGADVALAYLPEEQGDTEETRDAIESVGQTALMAQNLVSRGIRVNCVAPGPVWTPLNPSDKPAGKVATFGADTPLRRPAQPEEIAPAYVFFASNADSSYITGEVLTLLGGETTAA
jgi:NAD(P)-dependent dehydrogenase (short-subunit alcohol dehydrogenase family)